MTAGTIESLRREVERLRAELSSAFEMAREIGEERNDLARNLGAEVARNEFLLNAIDVIDTENRRHEDAMRGANDYTRSIRDVVIAAREHGGWKK